MGRPIMGHQAIAFMLADMTMAVESSRAMVWKSCWTKDAGLRNSYYASIAKCMASRAAVENANSAVQIYGGMGFNTESPVEKLYRDAKVSRAVSILTSPVSYKSTDSDSPCWLTSPLALHRSTNCTKERARSSV